jgi:cell wall-associated NlpC family hydrolase
MEQRAVDDAGVDLIVERAVEFTLGHLGSEDYELRCLAFVEDAYEQPNGIEVFGGAFARESADLYGALEATGPPPRGAFVFFSTRGSIDGVDRDWGHVGLAIGDGRMIHAWPIVRIDALEAVPSLPSGDWSPPSYLGWAPASRILRGARARLNLRQRSRRRVSARRR